MEIRASHQFARISPKKVRPVVSAIVGKRMDQAMAALASSPRRAAAMVSKVLKSAAANAENSDKVECDPEEMVVSTATVDDGSLPMTLSPGRGKSMTVERPSSYTTQKARAHGWPARSGSVSVVNVSATTAKGVQTSQGSSKPMGPIMARKGAPASG